MISVTESKCDLIFLTVQYLHYVVSDVFPCGSPFVSSAFARVQQTGGQQLYLNGGRFPGRAEASRTGCDASARRQDRRSRHCWLRSER